MFLCTGTVITVGTLVPVTLCLCLYVTGTTLVLFFLGIVTVGTVDTLVQATLLLCTNMLLVLHWYWSLYEPVLWVLLVHWFTFYVSVTVGTVDTTGTATLLLCTWYCYWYCTGTMVHMNQYYGYCWFIGTSHSMSLCIYVTGTTLVLLFICTGTVGTVGTMVQATVCLSTNVTGTALVLLFICTGTVGTIGNWYQPLYVNVSICSWYHTGTALYMYWYFVYC